MTIFRKSAFTEKVLMVGVILLAVLALVAGSSQTGRAQGPAKYPITVVPAGKGPYTFPDGYQMPGTKFRSW